MGHTASFSDYSKHSVAGYSFLIHRLSGAIFSLNGTGEMFFDLLQNGMSSSELAAEVAGYFQLDQAKVFSDLEAFQKNLASPETHAFVAEEPYSYIPHEEFSGGLDQQTSSGSETVLHFQVAATLFEVHIPSRFDLSLTEAILAPLVKTKDLQSPEQVLIEFEEGKNAYLVKVAGRPEMAFTEPDMASSFLISAITGYLCRQMDFSASFHAGAIHNQNGQAVMFAAPSGHGKSTLIVEMSLRGYGYLGDDLTIVDLEQKNLQAVPTAANLKPGSWDLFKKSIPELEKLPCFYEDTRPAKFLSVPIDTAFISASLPLRAVVFPQFQAGTEGEIRKLSPNDLFKRLMHAGIYTNAEASEQMSRHFIQCFMSVPAVSISYPNTEVAIDLLRSEQII